MRFSNNWLTIFIEVQIGLKHTRKNFKWTTFLITQIPCGFVTFIAALFVDNALRHFGVQIHPWREAIISGVAGMFFSSLFVPLLWRLNLVTVPQYMIGAIGIFVPATLLSLLVVAQFQPLIIDVNSLEFVDGDTRAWAMSMYVRIARSALLVPVYIFMFWLVYHRYLGHKQL